LNMRDKDDCNVTLTEHGIHRPASPTDNPDLLIVDAGAKYRLTTSPALWSVQALRSYTHRPENAWQFEVFGSWRARRRTDSFYIANPAQLSTGREGVIPYFQAKNDTGIVQGRWQLGIPQLFEQHGIKVDYSERGFIDPESERGGASRLRTMRKLLANPRKCLLGGSISSR